MPEWTSALGGTLDAGPRPGAAAMDLARSLLPEVVLMDIRIPGTDGLEATRQIAADPELSGVRVIILTTFEADEYVFEAIRAGASGFLSIRHVVSAGSGPVPRAENMAGELCATTMRPSPPTATRPPVEPRWASSCSKVPRTASARFASA
jgi:chemotaxis response regulator CheB